MCNVDESWNCETNDRTMMLVLTQISKDFCENSYYIKEKIPWIWSTFFSKIAKFRKIFTNFHNDRFYFHNKLITIKLIFCSPSSTLGLCSMPTYLNFSQHVYSKFHLNPCRSIYLESFIVYNIYEWNIGKNIIPNI